MKIEYEYMKIYSGEELKKFGFMSGPMKRGRPKAEKIVQIEYLKDEHKKLIASLNPLYMFEIKNWREQYKEYTLNGLVHYINEYAKSLNIELLIVRIEKNLEIERIK